MRGLTGKAILVTGSSNGIGRAMAERLVAEGAKVVVHGRDREEVEGVCRELGDQAAPATGDLANPETPQALIDATVAAFGRIDVLVNVAGGSGPVGKTGWETTREEFDEIVELNMTGCFNTMSAVMPVLIGQRYGKIVNVGGTFGMRGRAGRMAYSASKWGLRGITKSFALEAGPHNINVNCVAPGMVEGPRFRGKVVPEMAKRLGITEEEAAEKHAADYALRRVSTGEDVAQACLFLASDAARQITGVDLPVDGGWASL